MEHHHEIAKIAYELYLMRDGAPGDPVSDWVLAERIFEERNLQKKAVASSKARDERTVKPRARKAAAPAEKATRNAAKKPGVKAASPKVEKAVEAPKAGKAARKKAAGNPVE